MNAGWSALGIGILTVIGCRQGPPTTDRTSEMPAEATRVLEEADELQLLLFDDRLSSPVEKKRVTIRDRGVRARLIEALKKGVQDSHGWSKGCVHPRLYVIKASRGGKTTTFRISFECWGVHMSDPDLDFSTSDSPQPAFDAVLHTAQ